MRLRQGILILVVAMSLRAACQQSDLAPADIRSRPTPLRETLDGEKVYCVNAGVTSPRLLRSVDAQYTDEARAARFSGVVELYFIVDKNGDPKNIRVRHGVGMGLNEAAVEAAKHYKFSPGTVGGQPVNVAIYIDVQFKMLS